MKKVLRYKKSKKIIIKGYNIMYIILLFTCLFLHNLPQKNEISTCLYIYNLKLFLVLIIYNYLFMKPY